MIKSAEKLHRSPIYWRHRQIVGVLLHYNWEGLATAVPNLELNLFGGFELRAARGNHPNLSSKKGKGFARLSGAFAGAVGDAREAGDYALGQIAVMNRRVRVYAKTLSVLRRTFLDHYSTLIQNGSDGLSVEPITARHRRHQFRSGVCAKGELVDLEQAAEPISRHGHGWL